jgi:hypothetical protein
MFSYFRDLLGTLRELLAAINRAEETLVKSEKHLEKLNECINDGGRGKPSITIRSWKE